MASWSILKTAIKQYIKANGNHEITGPVLQSVLNNIVSSIGANATLAGIATPLTNPGTPDGPVFYLANENGTYSNFSNITLLDEAAILTYSPDTGLWAKFAITQSDFISSSHDDTAEGLITFNKGLIALATSLFKQGLEAKGTSIFDILKANSLEVLGDIIAKNISISDTIATKNLEVTGSAHFFQLIIDQIRSVGGRVIISLASCKAAYVEYLDSDLNIVPSYDASTVSYFRVYFCANDGDNKVTNNFAVGDLAIAMTFNAGEGSYSSASNKYYWRAIKNCSYSALTYSFDNFAKKYYYIDLYNTEGYYDTDSNAIPEVGDSIVQLGSINNDSRASTIILSAYNDNWLDAGIKAPCIAQYMGIGREAAYRFDLAHYRYTWFALNSNEIKGNLKVITSSGAQDIVDYVDGEIKSTKASFTVENEKITASVEKVEQSIDTLSDDLNVLSETVETNKSSIEQRADRIEASVESVSKSITTVGDDLRALSETVEFNKSSIEQTAESIEARVTSAEGSLNALQETVDDIPVKTQSQLDIYTSSIKQSAKEISLEVNQELDARKNLLSGTDFTLWDETKFKANDASATTIIRTSDGMYGHNSIEVSRTNTSVTYPGVLFKGIPVTKGVGYFVSTYIKKVATISAGAIILIQHLSDEDGTTVANTTAFTYSNNSMPDNQWALFGGSFTASTNYINIIFCQPSTGTFRISLPMLEKGSARTIWTKSDKDHYYIGGNLIPYSKTLGKVTGSADGITAVGTKEVDTDGNTMSVVTATATYNSSTGSWTPGSKFPLTFRQTFSAGVDYILSFYIRRIDGPSTNQVTINLNKNILYSELYTGAVSKFSQMGGSTPYSGYHSISNVPTEWTRVWLHFRVYESSQIASMNVQAYAATDSITVQLKQPKLEASAYPTEWTESAESYIEEYNIANQLSKTGIDIMQGTIKLSAENTIIDGDLYLRGILVENCAEKASKSLVICDLVRNKSVSVSRSLVVLPMINTVYNDFGVAGGGTPNSYSIAAVTEAGIKLTIAAKYEAEVAKWASATASLYASYPNAMSLFHNYATIIFADPRIASYGNYNLNGTAKILPEGGGGIQVSGYEGGVFVCNGRRGRILLLMPGQTLHLTSAIETINGSSRLIWYIDNGSEFTSISKVVRIVGYGTYSHGFSKLTGSSWPSEPATSSGSEYEDSIFAPLQLCADYSGSAEELNIELDDGAYTYL
jgi:hypothetical protein